MAMPSSPSLQACSNTIGPSALEHAMLMFEWILALLLAAVLLKVLAERIAVPYPSLLAIAGGGLVLCAFCVVPGPLVLQGLTLRPLLRFLRFADDGVVESEISRARVAIMQAAVE